MSPPSKKKKLLVVAYFFPPVGGGGVQRTVKFAKYLPEFGWEPIILTVKDVAYRSFDATPLDGLPDLSIERTGSLDPFRLIRIARCATRRSRPEPTETRRLESFDDLDRKSAEERPATTSLYERAASLSKYIFIPDIQVGWIPFALLKALEICHKENVSAVYTTSPPESVHFVGMALKKRLSLPWAADFRDVWEPLFWRQELPSVHRSINRKLERAVLSAADGLVLNTRPALDRVEETVNPRVPVAVIPNGFDRADFEGEGVDKRDDCFVIVHYGNFGAGLEANVLLRAFASVCEQNEEFRRSAKLYLIGVNKGKDVALINELGIGGNVFNVGYLPYREGLRFCKAADLLLLIMGPAFEKDRVPGKFYGYLGAGRPLFAVVPEGETERLAREIYDGLYIARPDDGEGIAREFVTAFQRWRSGVAPYAPNPAKVREYDRAEQTRELAELLDEVGKRVHKG
jgi:hypothetical protein